VSQRRWDEVQGISLRPFGGGFSIIGKPALIENFLAYYRRRVSHQVPTISEGLGSELVATFPADANGIILETRLEQWKAWYASEAFQALGKYLELLKQFAMLHSNSRPVLHIPNSTLGDFSRLTVEDWEAEGWNVDDDDVRILRDMDRTNAIDALARIFRSQEVAGVIVGGSNFEFVPSTDEAS